MTKQSKAGGFFPLDTSVVQAIVHEGGEAEEVIAYIATAAHTQSRKPSPHRLSTSGVKAIYTCGGVPIRRAQKAMTWLTQNEFLLEADDARERYGEERVPLQFGHSAIRPRYWVKGNQDKIENAANLPHVLLRGIPGLIDVPPLKRLYEEIDTDPAEGITTSMARLDAVMLLVHLYQHHRLDKCGGVDPRGGLYRQWNIADEKDEALQDLMLNPVEDVPGTNAALYEVRGSTDVTFLKFAKAALFYVSNQDDRMARFWCALRNLQSKGLMYETVAVWNADPNKDKTAEPLYTLYIRDKYARDNGEPYLQKAVHSAVDALFGFEVQRLWDDEWTTPGLIALSKQAGGGFRFIASKKLGGYPIGIYRLRHRPQDKETGLWIQGETRRVNDWAKAIRKLHRH